MGLIHFCKKWGVCNDDRCQYYGGILEYHRFFETRKLGMTPCIVTADISHLDPFTKIIYVPNITLKSHLIYMRFQSLIPVLI